MNVFFIFPYWLLCFQTCLMPKKLSEIMNHWLRGRMICVSPSIFIVPILVNIAFPVVLLTNPSEVEHCPSMIISSFDSWTLKPLLTPSVQKVLIVYGRKSQLNVSIVDSRYWFWISTVVWGSSLPTPFLAINCPPSTSKGDFLLLWGTVITHSYDLI